MWLDEMYKSSNILTFLVSKYHDKKVCSEWESKSNVLKIQHMRNENDKKFPNQDMQMLKCMQNSEEYLHWLEVMLLFWLSLLHSGWLLHDREEWSFYLISLGSYIAVITSVHECSFLFLHLYNTSFIYFMYTI